jgi:MoxR-like ATPase
MGGEYRRVQFTPDLLPTDITGSSVYNQGTSEFEFRPGPVFANVVLADEINRATPKTQSALLEAMEEHQVTSDGESRQLPKPFFVIATQNSVEMTGTYPLPEAQLDRFFMRLSIGYPSRQAEAAILAGHKVQEPLESLKAVTTPASVIDMQGAVRDMFVHESIVGYIVDIVRATRESPLLTMGASPRGSLHLMRAAQAHAAMAGFEFTRPDDVQAVAPFVLSHRVLARAEVRMRGGADAVNDAVRSIVESVPVPPSVR